LAGGIVVRRTNPRKLLFDRHLAQTGWRLFLLPHSNRLGFYPFIDIHDLNRQAEEHMDFPG
jgi:hypothetical protein